MERLYERLRALSDGADRARPAHRISRAYEHASWAFMFLAVLVWIPFAMPSVGFYLAAMMLRREGL